MDTVTTDTNGRLSDGTFAPGNQAAAGHKRRQHVAKLRAAFTSCLTESDIVDVVAVLLRQAKDGDTIACRLLLDRALGRVASPAEFEVLDDQPDEQRPRTVADLGPVTPANIEQHRAARWLKLAEIGHRGE